MMKWTTKFSTVLGCALAAVFLFTSTMEVGAVPLTSSPSGTTTTTTTDTNAAEDEKADAAAEDGNERALLALKVFAHKVRFYIGAYIAEMNGVDAIVFTAGVGENDIAMRDIICNDLGNLGIKLDLVKNKVRGKETIISMDDSRVKLLLIPTNEELMIARDTYHIVKGTK